MSEDLRVTLTALAAILVPAILGTAILAVDGRPLYWPALLFGLGIACVIAFLHLFLLGLPLWILISRYVRIRWWGAALLGFVVGVLPVSLLLLLPDWLQYPRLFDWHWAAHAILFCGLLGASSGLSIRAVRGVNRRPAGEEPE